MPPILKNRFATFGEASPELVADLSKSFKVKFGRDPRGEDPLWFDPFAEQPAFMGEIQWSTFLVVAKETGYALKLMGEASRLMANGADQIVAKVRLINAIEQVGLTIAISEEQQMKSPEACNCPKCQAVDRGAVYIEPEGVGLQ